MMILLGAGNQGLRNPIPVPGGATVILVPINTAKPMTATVFKYLSYLGLIVGIILSFWVIRGGALCFLFSIACAHLAGTARADKHAAHIHETLFIVLSILGQVNKKLDEAKAASAATAEDTSHKVQRLPTVQTTAATHKAAR